jgi:hypothetical protein
MARQPFNERAVSLAKNAMESLLQDVPELQSVCVVFDWGDRNPHELHSVFMDQKGQIGRLTPDSGFQLTSQMTQVQQVLHSALNHNLLELQGKYAEALQNSAGPAPASDSAGGPAAAPED